MVRSMILKIDLGKYKLELGNGCSKSGAITGRWVIKNRIWDRRAREGMKERNRRKGIKILSKDSNKTVVQQKKVVNHFGINKNKWFLIQKDSRIMNRK